MVVSASPSAVGAVRQRDLRAARGHGPIVTLAWIGAVLLSLVPVLSTAIPPLLDYPNHYARLWLITGGAQDPVMAPMYQVDWNVAWTNILTDLVAVGLRSVASLDVISHLLVSLGLLLPAFGLLALNVALFGAPRWWNVVCVLLVWNVIFLAGFLNFSMGLGLALLAAAGEVRLAAQPQALRAAYRIGAAAVVLAAHPFALMFLVLLQAALAFGPDASLLTRRAQWPAALKRGLAYVLPCIVPLVALVLFGPALPGSDTSSVPSGAFWYEFSLANVVSVLLTYFKTYDFRIDAIYIAIFAGSLLAAALRRRLAVHGGLLLLVALLALVSPFVPHTYRATGAIDLRLPSMMALTLAAGLRPRLFETRRAAILAASVALLLVGSRMLVVERVWLAAERNMAAVETALAPMPPGAALLPLQNIGERALNSQAPMGRFLGRSMPLHWHYGSLAVFRQRAFIPNLFTSFGKQPIRVLPPYLDISVPEGAPAAADRLTKPVQSTAPYLADWRHRFDYILLLNADMPNAGGPMPDLPELTLVSDTGFARLYKIAH